jgi:hypothetical protein
VLLAGGFARSPYLRRRLEQHLPSGVPLVVPPDPEIAVLAGAVHYAYDPSVIRERRSRLTYGCNDTPLFEAGLDPAGKRIRAGIRPDRCLVVTPAYLVRERVYCRQRVQTQPVTQHVRSSNA